MPPMDAPSMDAPSMDAPNGMPQGDETDMGNGGMNNEEPPLGDDGGMGNDAPPMGDDGSMPEESEGNGVGKDVREYSGKLSQALNDYNQENTHHCLTLGEHCLKAYNYIKTKSKD